MGHHKPSTTAVCVDCEMLAQMKQETTRETTKLKQNNEATQ